MERINMSDERFDRNSRSRSRSSEEISSYPLKISISQDLIPHFNDPEIINKIKNESSASKITISQNLDTSSYTEGVISIYSGTMSCKLTALAMVCAK